MKNDMTNTEKAWRCFLWGIFIAYMIVLLRITLFKQASLYNLFAAVGASERTVNVIPFKSVFDMVASKVSLTRIAENVVGNILLFVPFGLLFPAISHKKGKAVFIFALSLSALIELLQLVFGLGSTDIDDLIWNTLGAMAGFLIFWIIQKKGRTNISVLRCTAVVAVILGGLGLGVLLVHQTSLFMTAPYETVVENGDLVEGFIDTPNAYSGKYIQFENAALTFEKSVRSASEPRETLALEVTADSDIYICYDEMAYFFSAVSGERLRYEKLAYEDFITQANALFGRDNNVLIWSADKSTIDHLVIIVWSE